MFDVRPYQSADEDELVRLWRLVFPDAPAHNDPRNDIRMKLSVQPELLFVAVVEDQIIGSAMSGFDGHRGWVYYVAVHPEYRRMGIGSALMKKVESAMTDIGCPKLNLQIRADNQQVQLFYESLGYDEEDRISMGKKLIG
jgi:ribosomal protein S18 acetylase RimI-like enzyme